ncbi:bifunctional demethylmenaquinone methyltransferase/2-methoxy-6-polyprenyl-1,4-benzoquinol methylase UbiE [Merismopedia glauca]|uniref:2-phytyl-1,4-naphtoquinone methyltransferase n=1 Tax=Merismopedia glauca CCAP 1448/3 TaxID=1296344 RepID=A0A2T1C133_9CYAN|nr:bifunctional demethylmenaquinone methyltransferase/2-methoxy-6-polyprenyl-1,4-benzoquinol methylase UbiE [Merismopedia glauca]PSB01979.1 bifunctional demethylmenaquinone methyltransferase/2-methoxy-6-polyprenyl-1,4-benzoquinol methylase UbiE [Merismopedia glauca CCAP 1448/3]
MTVESPATTPNSSQIRDIFNNIAPVYDRLNDRISFGLHRIWKQMTVKWSQVKPGDTCLDLCCGSGDIAILLAKTVGKTGQVIGADFAVQQLAIAQQRAQNQFFPVNISWVEADALNLPFADNFFDAVTMGYGLRNVTDIPLCLRELHRVLKPGAKAAILDFHRPSDRTNLKFQQWYLDYIVVPTAQEFGLTEEYAYIAPSLERFPVGSEQVELAKEAGFSQGIHYLLVGGAMGVLVLTK